MMSNPRYITLHPRYALLHPLALTDLSRIRLNKNELRWLRQTRKSLLRGIIVELNRREEATARQWKIRGHPDAETLRATVARVAQLRSSILSEEDWMPQCGAADRSGGATFDPLALHRVGLEISAHLHHIPSFFDVGIVDEAGVFHVTRPQAAFRIIDKQRKPAHPQVMVRQDVLRDPLVREWIWKIFQIFYAWLMRKHNKRAGRPPKLHAWGSRIGARHYTRETVNHYIPGMSLTMRELDEILKSLWPKNTVAFKQDAHTELVITEPSIDEIRKRIQAMILMPSV